MSQVELTISLELWRERRETLGLSHDRLAEQVKRRLGTRYDNLNGERLRRWESGTGLDHADLAILATVADVLDLKWDSFAPGMLDEKEQVTAILERISYFNRSPQASGAVA